MFVETEKRPQGEPHGEPQVKPMKLSEAIREGAKLRPQYFGADYFGNGGSCALGAAYEAVTGHGHYYADDAPTIEDLFPSLTVELEMEIWDKNDQECLSREQIADWLEARGY